MIAYEPEGTPFANEALEALWSSHPEKLKKVYEFFVEEKYWFGAEESDPEANAASLGAIRRWTRRHDKLKQRGFYVDIWLQRWRFGRPKGDSFPGRGIRGSWNPGSVWDFYGGE